MKDGQIGRGGAKSVHNIGLMCVSKKESSKQREAA